MRRPKSVLALVAVALVGGICFEQAPADQPMLRQGGGQIIGLSDEIVVLPKRGRNKAKQPAASPATIKPGGLIGLSQEIIFLPKKKPKHD